MPSLPPPVLAPRRPTRKIKVGKVDKVGLNKDGNKVDVVFTVADTWIGDQTQASIQIGSPVTI